MKLVVVKEVGVLEVIDVPEPEPEPNQIKLRLRTPVYAAATAIESPVREADQYVRRVR